MNTLNGDKMLGDAFTTPVEDVERFASCPDPERIWAAIECKLPAEERRVIVDHMTTCPNCAATWRVAKEMGVRPPLRTVVMNWIRGWFQAIWVVSKVPHFRPVGVAVVMLVVAASALHHATRPVVHEDARSGEFTSGEFAYRGGGTAPPAEDGVLSREDAVLRWEHQEGVSYELQVTNEDLRIIVEIHLDATEYQLSKEQLAKIKPGSKIYWRVDKIYPDGTKKNQIASVTRVE